MSDRAISQANGKWVHLKAADVAGHPLYGVRGWLAVFLALQIVGLLYATITEFGTFRVVVVEFGTLLAALPVFALIAILTLPLLLLSLWMLLLGYGLNPRFRAVALWSFGLGIFQDLALMIYLSSSGVLKPADILGDVLQLIVSGSLWTYYFMSRRVRVTYLWQVTRDDPHLATVERERRGPLIVGAG